MYFPQTVSKITIVVFSEYHIICKKNPGFLNLEHGFIFKYVLSKDMRYLETSGTIA